MYWFQFYIKTYFIGRFFYAKHLKMNRPCFYQVKLGNEILFESDFFNTAHAFKNNHNMNKFLSVNTNIEPIAIIDFSSSSLTIIDVPGEMDNEQTEDYLIQKGFKLSSISWGFFDGVINDLRDYE